MTKLIETRSPGHNDAVRRGRVLAISLTAALIAGCTLDLSGLPARADSGGTSAVGSSTTVSGTTTTTSTSAGSGGAGGAGGTIATSTSASVSSSGTTLPCTPTGAEICDDGIDNDCNQATDCEDPACAVGFVCLPAIPSGTSATCSSPKLTFYTDGGCATGALNIPVTGSCDPLNGAARVDDKSYKYTANIVNAQCQTITDAMPTGSFVLQGARTVCCQ